MSKLKTAAIGLICGAANGLFGSGGGMIAVPMLENDDLDTRSAHATSLALMLPISAASSFVYLKSGSLDIMQALKYLPGGIIGVYIGSRLLKKISAGLLKKLFAAVMIYFGIRLLIR
ncbi:MAG: sulfite exporter TauE/SafE family protein [Oscillospiraceae bacterium]